MDEYKEILTTRITQYMDFMFFEARWRLDQYRYTLQLDVQQEAMDLVQEAAVRILESKPKDPHNLGTKYFTTVVETAFLDFLRYRNRAMRGGTGAVGKSVPVFTVPIEDFQGQELAAFEEEDATGFIALKEAVVSLPDTEKAVVVERYLGYRPGTLSKVSASATRYARARAANRLAAYAA